MNVEFPKIMSNLKLGEVGARQADNVDKITENAAKKLFWMLFITMRKAEERRRKPRLFRTEILRNFFVSLKNPAKQEF